MYKGKIMLDTLSIAPDFTLEADTGDTVTLSEFQGAWVVLYFYPKDNTPGCTIEAQNFRDKIKDFEKLNCKILGVSCDSIRKHQGFKAKHDLPFLLLSDTETTVCQQYHVYVEKSMFGKKYMGIERSTFLIDPKGVIQHIWPKVKIKEHANTVLSALKQYQSNQTN